MENYVYLYVVVLTKNLGDREMKTNNIFNSTFIVIEHKSNKTSNVDYKNIYEFNGSYSDMDRKIGPTMSDMKNFDKFHYMIYQNSGKTLTLIREKIYQNGMLQDNEY